MPVGLPRPELRRVMPRVSPSGGGPGFRPLRCSLHVWHQIHRAVRSGVPLTDGEGTHAREGIDLRYAHCTVISSRPSGLPFLYEQVKKVLALADSASRNLRIREDDDLCFMAVEFHY